MRLTHFPSKLSPVVLMFESKLFSSLQLTQRPNLTPIFNSTIRQVPDSQEVYLSSIGFTSIVFDITERVSNVSSDEEALKFHFSDIVDPNDTVQVLSTDAITFTKLP